jgi:hypothetical protein
MLFPLLFNDSYSISTSLVRTITDTSDSIHNVFDICKIDYQTQLLNARVSPHNNNITTWVNKMSERELWAITTFLMEYTNIKINFKLPSIKDNVILYIKKCVRPDAIYNFQKCFYGNNIHILDYMACDYACNKLSTQIDKNYKLQVSLDYILYNNKFSILKYNKQNFTMLLDSDASTKRFISNKSHKIIICIKKIYEQPFVFTKYSRLGYNWFCVNKQFNLENNPNNNSCKYFVNVPYDTWSYFLIFRQVLYKKRKKCGNTIFLNKIILKNLSKYFKY